MTYCLSVKLRTGSFLGVEFLKSNSRFRTCIMNRFPILGGLDLKKDDFRKRICPIWLFHLCRLRHKLMNHKIANGFRKNILNDSSAIFVFNGI